MMYFVAPVWRTIFIVLALCATLILWPRPTAAANCAQGGDYNFSITQDTTWSGTVYIGSDVRLRNATLTIEPGTRVVFCGPHWLSIGDLFSPGRLIAQGTADDPIIFEPDEGVDNWEAIYFSDAQPEPSIMRHVELRRAGATDNPASPKAAIITSDRHRVVGQVSPVIDRVTISDSAGYGINLGVNEQNDDTTAALSRVTISGSALAPIITDAGGVDGIGRNNTLTGNGVDRILVRGDNLNGSMSFSQRFRNLGIPYEIQGSLSIRDADDDPTTGVPSLTIEQGVTFLMAPNAGITVGSLFGDATLHILGTEDAPVTIQPLDSTNDYWGTILFDNFSITDSKIEHANLLRGGRATFAQNSAVLRKDGSGLLTLESVQISDAVNGAIAIWDGAATINNSSFSNNNFGIYVVDADLTVRNSRFIGNAEGAINNVRAANRCVDAVNNFWGDAAGPNDASNSADGCGNLGQSNNSPSGQLVTNGILYTPWQSTVDGQTPNQGSILPDPFWTYADGAGAVTLAITLVDGNGAPLVGKQVQINTTLGTLQQPTVLTDAEGRTTATITSTVPGFARISAVNVTDTEPVAGIATVTFGRGSRESFGMVELQGAPYSAPELIVEGKPFQEGFPITFRMPMRNSNPYPVQVEVQYGYHFYGLGLGWTAVDVVTRTMQPGDNWDAQGGWTPFVTGHHCVQARVTVTPLAAPADAASLTSSTPTEAANGGSFSRQVNKDIKPSGGGNSNPPPNNPPKPPPPDCGDSPGPKDMVPPLPKSLTPAASTKAIYKHYTKKLPKLYKYASCKVNNLTDPPVHGYDQIATPPVYTWETVVLEEGLTQPMVDALNVMGAQKMIMMGLTEVMETTLDRMGGASIAEDWPAAAAQLAAFQGFVAQYANASDTYADALNALLLATPADADIDFDENDYRLWLVDLKANGLEADEVAFLTASGFSSEQIAEITAETIRILEEDNFETTSLFEILSDQRDNARRTARMLRSTYLPGGAVQAGQVDENAPVPATLLVQYFLVGNPTESKATVQLTVIPVSMPASWRYSLSATEIELEAGAQTNAYLQILPGTESMERGSEAVFAVEGTIGNELIGGVEVRIRAPETTVTRNIYLPLLER
ncbi:hypothetical protein GC175_26290 [bacterium]|nr:hypothetical protein [bacterium]